MLNWTMLSIWQPNRST